MTKKEARILLEANKDNTAYYNGFTSILDNKTNFCTYDELFNFFHIRCNMGEAEANCIISALVLSGAKIQ